MRTPRGVLGTTVGALLLAVAAVGCGGTEEPPPRILVTPTAVDDPAAGFVPLEADGYSIKLPGSAVPFQQTVTVQGRPLTFTGYRATDGGAGYFAVNLLDNPGTAPLNLAAAIQSAAAAVGGTVQADEPFRFRKFDGRQGRYTASLSGTDLTLWVVVLDVHDQLFQLQYALPEKDLTVRPEIFDTVLATLVIR